MQGSGVPANAAEPPAVSIVTPSLNQGRFIEDTILSVQQQDYPRIEHLVIDGGSTDGTLDILRRYSGLTWVSEPDAGQSDAINKGFRRAGGDILAWLNADDTYKPGAVKSAVDFLTARPDVDLVYGDCDEVDEEGRFIATLKSRPFDLRGYVLFDFEIPQPSTFFRRRVIDKVGGVNGDLHLAMDHEFWIRIGRACALEYSGELWSTYRIHPAAKTTARISEELRDQLAILDGVFADAQAPASLVGLRRKAYSNAYLSGCFRSCEVGALAQARSRFWAGLRQYPNPLRMKVLKALLLFLDAGVGVRWGHHLLDRLRRFRWRDAQC